MYYKKLISGENLFKSLPTTAQTTAQIGSIITFTIDGTQLDPFGNNRAYKLTTDSQLHKVSFLVSKLKDGVEYIFSFYVKKGTSPDLKYSVYDRTKGKDIISPTSYFNNIGSGWTRIDLSVICPVGSTSLEFYLDRDSSIGTSFFAYWQLNTNNLKPYV